MINKPAHKILILIREMTSAGSDGLLQMRQLLPCWHSQSLRKDSNLKHYPVNEFLS